MYISKKIVLRYKTTLKQVLWSPGPPIFFRLGAEKNPNVLGLEPGLIKPYGTVVTIAAMKNLPGLCASMFA